MKNFTDHHLNIHKHQYRCNFISCIFTNHVKTLIFKDQIYKTKQKPDNTRTELLSMTKKNQI